MENKNRVQIAIGCQENVKAKTLGSIMGMMILSHNEVTGYSMRQGGDIVSARTFCVQDAQEKKATHILFVDSDMVFPPDTLKRLLAQDKDIITVEYNRRKLPPEPVTQPLEERYTTIPYKARVIGAGCLLIKMTVFDKISKPWFNFGRNSKGELVIGEDTWFLNTARDAGIDTWIDPTIKVGHLGEYAF